MTIAEERGLSKHTRTRLVKRDGKKVREHRWLMEQQLGRKLLPTEEVHHRNHDPLDNRLENLVVLTREEHIAHHAADRLRYPTTKTCANCGEMFTPNPRRRKRQKCCSHACAQAMRVAGTIRAGAYRWQR